MRTFEYRVTPGRFVVGLILGLIFIIGAVLAIANGWGLRMFSVALSPEQSTVLYLILALLGAVILILSALVFRAGAREITVSDSGIRVPKSESSRTMLDIPYSAITRLERGQYGGTHSLVISHSGRKTKVFSPHFSSFDQYAEFVESVEGAAAQR